MLCIHLSLAPGQLYYLREKRYLEWRSFKAAAALPSWEYQGHLDSHRSVAMVAETCYVSFCTYLFPMQVMVGHLETGDCIGEGMLRGNDHQPYTIVSTTKLRVGWVTTTTLRGEGKVKQTQKVLWSLSCTLVTDFFPVSIVNEVEKHILSDKKFTLEPLTTVSVCVPVYTWLLISHDAN